MFEIELERENCSCSLASLHSFFWRVCEGVWYFFVDCCAFVFLLDDCGY